MADYAELRAIFDSDDEDAEFSGFSDVDSDETSDSSDDDEREPNVLWTNHLQPPRMEDFTETAGPNLPEDFDTDSASPLAYFLLMFPMALISLIVEMTNAYAAWTMAQPGDKETHWEETNLLEMRAFLAINILMGINRLPETSMYWSTNTLIGNSAISRIMTAKRFQKLIKYLHVSDRATEPERGQPNYDRLFKVRPVLDVIGDTFRRFYTLSREVAVDEAMIAFRGRLAYRQYMPAKPIKRGVKVWMLCDARTAFLSRFEVYLGRQHNQTEHGLGYNVVMKLTEQIRRTFRWVFFDNFFTGVKLLQDLLDVGLYACGTVRPNRKGFPAQLKKPADVRQRGESKALQNGGTNLTATVWKDKKLVHHLSTLSDPTRTANAQRRVGPNVLNVSQPHSVQQYNQFMGGVDRHDQHRAKYAVGRNGKKAWRYIFWFALNSAIVNAYIIYKSATSRTTKKRFSHLDFRLELINELIGGFTKRKRKREETTVLQGLVNQENIPGHTHVHMGPNRRECKYHRKKWNLRKDTTYGCEVCNVHLCVNGCHFLWHTSPPAAE